MDSLAALSMVTASEARHLGIPRSRLTSPVFARAAHGLYVPRGADVTSVDARIAVIARQLPEGFVIGGWAAARLHEQSARQPADQLTVFDGVLPEMDAAARSHQPILVCAGRGRRRRPLPGVTLFRSDLEPNEAVVVAGVRVTSAARTAFDLARLWPQTPAVVGLDRLRALGCITCDVVNDVVRRRPNWRGADRARRAIALSADGVESPRETMMRLLWVAAGLGRPMCNPVLRDVRGAFLARVDLLDATVGLVGEYDGEMHATAERRRQDARRQEGLEAAGLVTIRCNEPDIATAAGRRQWQTRLRLAHARARVRAASRSWVLAP